MDINPKLAICAGIGFITEKNESNFEFTDQVPLDPINFHTVSTEPKVSAVLLKFGTYYTIPLIRGINLFLNGGINYYSSKVSLYKSHGFHAEIDLSPYFKEDKYDVSSSNFGFYGGTGLSRAFVFLRRSLPVAQRAGELRVDSARGYELQCSGDRLGNRGITRSHHPR